MPNFGYSFPVDQLLFLGEKIAFQKDWPNYLVLGLTQQSVPDLIRMAVDSQLDRLICDQAEVWAPIHARRALGQLHAEAAFGPLLGFIGSQNHDVLDDWTFEEMPTVFSLFGPTIIPKLVDFIQRDHVHFYIRNIASRALAMIATGHPDTLPQCVAALANQLERFADQDPTWNSLLICDLVDLKATETLPLIERAYQGGAVDEFLNGDLEDVQIEMGVKSEREHPRARRFEWAPAPQLAWGMTSDQRRELTKQRNHQRKAEKKAKARRKIQRRRH